MSDRGERGPTIRRALEWVAGMLDELGIPFQVAGGLAAIAHGSDRPLHDIDIYVPRGTLDAIRSRVEEHGSPAPRRVRSEHWDCFFMEVRHAGVEIELAEAGRTRYRAGTGRPWYAAEVDFDRSVRREVFGMEVPVMPVEDLVRYKRRLGRPVDLEDLAHIDQVGEGT